MKKVIVLHSSRFGEDVFVIETSKPIDSLKDTKVAKELGISFEPERGEYIKFFAMPNENKPKGYLVTSYYVSPEDTLAKDERPDVNVKSGYFKNLKQALDFIEDGFDGKETWNDSFVPEIKEHFAKPTKKEYVVDDWSAGQWAVIVPHYGKNINYSF